ncbi:hypothetical protein LP420_20865 [Massilia sp. B-10]|nr:hypothetical protein LP420_20865 [Massilia sp. B-10]
MTGTDTEIGKTLVSSAILHTLVGRGVRACGMKPVAHWRRHARRRTAQRRRRPADRRQQCPPARQYHHPLHAARRRARRTSPPRARA